MCTSERGGRRDSERERDAIRLWSPVDILLLVLAGKVLRLDLEDTGIFKKGPGFTSWGLGSRVES